MDNHFDFLKQAKPSSLCKLLGQIPLADAAIALAGLPASLSVQTMAFFPEKAQAELMPAMREARQADPARAAATADRIKNLLGDMRKSQGAGAPPTPAKTMPYQSASPPTARPLPPPPEARPAPAKPAKPSPWIPRTATSSPINGPALPGKPPPVAGDPLRSPLAKAGLLDLIGRAQQKLLPKTPSQKSPPPVRPPAKRGARPEPREGVTNIRSVGISRTPRVIGPRPATRPAADEAPAGGSKNMDGKAILAAILREAGQDVRDIVRQDDPGLFRELRGRMFYFDDLMLTDDAALARVFTAAPVEESSLALRFAAPALRDRVFRVVSPGRAEALRDSYPSRAGVDAVERAQQKVLAIALQLQAAGRILIDPRDPDLAGS